MSSDLGAASIGTTRGKLTSDNAILDDIDKSNLNSVLLVVEAGHLFAYLDGTFPLGSVSIGTDTTVSCMLKHSQRPMFIGSSHMPHAGKSAASLRPISIEVPLLAQRKPRDLAKMSSTSRELVWYVLRVVKEMRAAWFGTESNMGARSLGPKWVQLLEAKQKEEFSGSSCPNAYFALNCNLCRGRSKSYTRLDLSVDYREIIGIVI